MNTRRLTPDLLTDASQWKLYVRIAPDSLSALLLGPDGIDRPVIAHMEPLADDKLKTLENAIYDNALLLSDFSSVSLILATSQLVQIPEAIEQAIAERIAEAMLPDSDDARTLIADSMPGGKLLAMISTDTLNFLKRTFPDADFSLSMSTEARGLESIRPTDKAVMFALCMPSELTLFCFESDGGLQFANRFDVTSAADCAYYILAAAGNKFFDIRIGGDADLRNDVIEQLRRTAPSAEISPLVLPDRLFDLRRDAPELTADLIFKASTLSS